MPGRAALFIDGAYWKILFRHEFNAVQVDFEALSRVMTIGSNILRTYYYNCLPYQSPNSTVK